MAPGPIKASTQIAAVVLDDRAADRKPHPLPPLGREQRIEDALAIGRAIPVPVSSTETWTLPTAPVRLNRQDARLHRPHRVRGIVIEVEDHLLQLDRIARDGGKLLVEPGLDPDAVPLEIDAQQREYRVDEIVEIDRGFRVPSSLNIARTLSTMSPAR